MPINQEEQFGQLIDAYNDPKIQITGDTPIADDFNNPQRKIGRYLPKPEKPGIIQPGLQPWKPGMPEKPIKTGGLPIGTLTPSPIQQPSKARPGLPLQPISPPFKPYKPWQPKQKPSRPMPNQKPDDWGFKPRIQQPIRKPYQPIGVWGTTKPTETPINRWTAVQPPYGHHWEYNQTTGQRKAVYNGK